MAACKSKCNWLMPKDASKGGFKAAVCNVCPKPCDDSSLCAAVTSLKSWWGCFQSLHHISALLIVEIPPQRNNELSDFISPIGLSCEA